jgi:hypothetical protein
MEPPHARWNVALKIFLQSQLTYEGSRFAEEHGFDGERCVASHNRNGALGGYQILLAKLGTPAMDASHELIPATAAN